MHIKRLWADSERAGWLAKLKVKDVTQASRDYQAEVWEYAFRKIKESREQFRLKLAASDRELISEQVQE
jgi:hypothetical protein